MNQTKNKNNINQININQTNKCLICQKDRKLNWCLMGCNDKLEPLGKLCGGKCNALYHQKCLKARYMEKLEFAPEKNGLIEFNCLGCQTNLSTHMVGYYKCPLTYKIHLEIQKTYVLERSSAPMLLSLMVTLILKAGVLYNLHPSDLAIPSTDLIELSYLVSWVTSCVAYMMVVSLIFPYIPFNKSLSAPIKTLGDMRKRFTRIKKCCLFLVLILCFEIGVDLFMISKPHLLRSDPILTFYLIVSTIFSAIVLGVITIAIIMTCYLIGEWSSEWFMRRFKLRKNWVIDNDQLPMHQPYKSNQITISTI